MRRTFPLVLIFALAGSAVGQPVGKSYESLEALAADSALVVRGTIVSAEDPNKSSWRQTGDTVTFAVQESLKGDADTSKPFQFVMPRTSWPDRTLTNWAATKTPLLVFLSESERLGNRRASRFRYAPRSRAAVVDLSSNAEPQLLTLDYQPLLGVTAILRQAKAAVQATKSGAYEIVSTNVPFDRLPKGYWTLGSAYLSVPVRRDPGRVLRPDLSLRLTSKSQYDGIRLLAAHGQDAFLWDATTGKLVQRFKGSAEEVQAVTFCPVGAFSPAQGEILTGSGKRGGILGGSKDNAIRLWNVADGTVKKIFGPLMGPVMDLQWAPDAGRFISFSVESSGVDAFRQRLWEDFGATELFVFEGYDPQFSPDGSMVVCRNYEYGGVTSFVGVWDARTYLQLCTLPGEDRTFYSAKFSPYGNHLVTTATGANNAPLAEVWDAETGRNLLELDLQGARTFDAAYTHDGTRIVTVNRKTGLAVWNADSGKLVRTLDCPMEVHNLLLSPDGQRCLATWGPGRSFGKIQGASLWNIQTGKELLRIAEQAESLVGFSADGTTILGLDEPDGSSGTVWSSETGGVVRSIKFEEP